jgi:hypothetical protein
MTSLLFFLWRRHMPMGSLTFSNVIVAWPPILENVSPGRFARELRLAPASTLFRQTHRVYISKEEKGSVFLDIFGWFPRP